jgi:hypothetical protein
MIYDRRMWLRSGLAALALVACGSSPAQHPRDGLASDDAAIAAFRAAWAREVRPRIADPLVRRIDARMQETTALGRYLAQQHDCREGVRRIVELEQLRQGIEGERSLVVHGDLDALLGRDRCWSVLFMGGMPQLDVEGWLDRRGRLLIAFRIPG